MVAQAASAVNMVNQELNFNGNVDFIMEVGGSQNGLSMADLPESGMEDSLDLEVSMTSPPTGTPIPMPAELPEDGCCKIFSLHNYQGDEQEACIGQTV